MKCDGRILVAHCMPRWALVSAESRGEFDPSHIAAGIKSP
jgi:hypothetical protein